MKKNKKVKKYPDGGTVALPDPNRFVAPMSGVNPGVQQYNLNTQPLNYSPIIQVMQNKQANDIRRDQLDVQRANIALRRARLRQESGANFNKLRSELFKSMKKDVDSFQETFGLDPTSPRHRKLLDDMLGTYNSKMKDMFVAVSNGDATKATSIAAGLNRDLYNNSDYIKEATVLDKYNKWHEDVSKATIDGNVDPTVAMEIGNSFLEHLANPNPDQDWDMKMFDMNKVTFDRDAVQDKLTAIASAAAKGEKKIDIEDLNGLGVKKTTTLEYDDTGSLATNTVDYLSSYRDGQMYLSSIGFNLDSETGRDEAIDFFTKEYEGLIPGDQTTGVDYDYKTGPILKAEGRTPSSTGGGGKVKSPVEIAKTYSEIIDTPEGQSGALYVIEEYGEEFLEGNEEIRELLTGTNKALGHLKTEIDKIIGVTDYEPITAEDIAKYNQGESIAVKGNEFDDDYIITNHPKLVKEFNDLDPLSSDDVKKNYGVTVPEGTGIYDEMAAAYEGMPGPLSQRLKGEAPDKEEPKYIAIPQNDFAAFAGKYTDIGKAKKKVLKNKFIARKVAKGEYNAYDLRVAAEFLSDKRAQDAFFQEVWTPKIKRVKAGMNVNKVHTKVADAAATNTDVKLLYLAHHHGTVSNSNGFLRDPNFKIEGNENASAEVFSAWGRIDRFIADNPGASTAEIIRQAESNGDHEAVYEEDATSSAITGYQITYHTHKDMIQDFMKNWEGSPIQDMTVPDISEETAAKIDTAMEQQQATFPPAQKLDNPNTLSREEMDSIIQKPATKLPDYMQNIMKRNQN